MVTLNWKQDQEMKNIVLFAFWTFVESLQWLIVLVFIFSFIPIHPNPFVETLFPLHQKGVLPEREMLFYRVFVLLNIILQAGVLFIFRKRLSEKKLSDSIVFLTLVSAFWVFVQLFCVFKMIVTGKWSWSNWLFYAGLAGAVLSRVFWPELRTQLERFYQNYILKSVSVGWVRWVDIGFPIVIFLLIFVPDMDKALARIFVRDHFYHLDSFLMAPGWASLNGLKLNIDVISEYSMTIPVVFSRVMSWFGGFNYHNAVMIMIIATIGYYIGFYFLIRRWLGSVLIGVFGVLLAIKLQMFHWGVAPLIWQYPSATVLRSVLDLTVLYCIWRHLNNFRSQDLFIAAVICGCAVSYMLDTGIYLTGAFLFYLIVLVSVRELREKSFKKLIEPVVLFGLPFITAGVVAFVFQGLAIFQKEFWVNSFEFVSLFLNGWGALPMYDGLKERQFFAFVMGLIIPVVYAWTLVFIGAACLSRQMKWKNIFVAVVCVYGLALYHYFIVRSAVSSYYVVAIPFVAVVCFWLKFLTGFLTEHWQRSVKFFGVMSMMFALLTSYFFTFYPNILDLARTDWKQEKDFYKSEFNFDKDAALIARLTKRDDRIALISSFETAILLKAQRKPFFYYFPLIESSHMKEASFRGTYLHTISRMQKTLRQLEEAKPGYIFIEAKLFNRQIPPEYYQYYQTLTTLIDYVSANYVAAESGEYLLALKRK